ncbi:hypothetical protein L7F22_037583 [Adiantum nelumboides]|nr:hypothetical protein [Adiantum nelumboides]
MRSNLCKAGGYLKTQERCGRLHRTFFLQATYHEAKKAISAKDACSPVVGCGGHGAGVDRGGMQGCIAKATPEWQLMAASSQPRKSTAPWP